jgi:hypothetical protein
MESGLSQNDAIAGPVGGCDAFAARLPRTKWFVVLDGGDEGVAAQPARRGVAATLASPESFRNNTRPEPSRTTTASAGVCPSVNASGWVRPLPRPWATCTGTA